jgi:hypothetical protein
LLFGIVIEYADDGGRLGHSIMSEDKHHLGHAHQKINVCEHVVNDKKGRGKSAYLYVDGFSPRSRQETVWVKYDHHLGNGKEKF